MTMLVSLQQAKDRLKLDDFLTDADLQLYIEGASAAVLNYLKLPLTNYENSTGAVPVDSNGNPDGVPKEVQNAVLLLVGILVRDPDGAEGKDWDRGFLPAPVCALLYPLRLPSLS